MNYIITKTASYSKTGVWDSGLKDYSTNYQYSQYTAFK